MPQLGSLSFLFGPTLAFLAVGVLALLLRWVYATPPAVRRVRRPHPGEPRDYGLLAPIAEGRSREDAGRLRSVLLANGVRATVGDDEQGDYHVLVFHADMEKARALMRD